ncbi:toll/interleukin-1 receptor domain-containing protein [Alkalinema pantanalense CENA528]|uniref:toll/interleukin-1 receptor domain-containing protein n=1 Tax=Alkalinema pantanalense TaxID=1620705 RepID=UPI003D6E9A49
MNQIYISYAWKDDKSELGQQRELLVDRICQTLLAMGYNLIRDRDHLTLGQSIEQFMQEIGRGNYVILVISDKYLRSEYCMFEAIEVMKHKDYAQKIFPVVLSDANIYTKTGRVDYIQYWQQQGEQLAQLLGSIATESSSALVNVAQKIAEIASNVDEFIHFVQDKLSIDPAKNFDTFIHHLTQQIYEDSQKLRSQKSVLVAGTGNFQLPDEVNWCARTLGKKLADNQYNLITGGWEGVDYVVAEQYAATLAKSPLRLTDKLTQIVPQGKQPVFKGGRVEYTEPGVNEWLDCLRRADLVILIGGVGGTYETYQFAMQERIPVIPIVCTNGDAKRVFDEMLQTWEQQPMGKIAPEKFKSLNQYINNVETAEDVIYDVIDIVNEVIFAKTMLKG